jgi:hypothetical protein
MMNQTTENFWQAWSNFEWPEPKPITYRLYYNPDGSPCCYTMEDLPGNYIEVDRETYIGHFWNVRVVQEKLVFIQPSITVTKLQPDQEIGLTCHPQDVTVVVDHDRPHTKWNMTNNETH